VNIYSEEGRGTTVMLYLPGAMEGARRVEAQEKEIRRGAGELILVIEDDLDVRDLLANQVKNLGYRVTVVSSAAAAQRALAEGPPVDLVLSDVILPGGTIGREFAKQARASHPELRIIFISGYPVETARRAGFLGSDIMLLNKPFGMKNLAKALREALD
jgi:two-component system CheB/CheR fusion protein